jgi:DNA-binding response OmpR family regulator
MTSIYIVEDDRQIREELTILLEHNAYQVHASTRFDALSADILAADPDIVLLDLNLPCIDGHLVCRELRERSDVPIIVVTSRDSDLDELMSINLGADDFITKPYNPHILLARIASVLGRANKANLASGVLLTYGDVELDTSKCLVSHEGKSIELTRNEMRILQILMQHAEQIVARQSIQQELWESDQFIDDNTLTVNVNRLRTTLASIGLGDIIATKRGQGYCLDMARAD